MILDAEDGVPPDEKPATRALIAKALGRPPEPGGPARVVRINAAGHEHGEADLAASVRPGLGDLVLPKVQHAEEVETVAVYRDEREPGAGLDRGRVSLLVTIEPAGPLQRAGHRRTARPASSASCSAPRTTAGARPPRAARAEAANLIHAHSTLVAAARAAHVQGVDGVWPRLEDQEGLLRDVGLARLLWFSGKALFHPSQIDAINEAFSPTMAEIDYAERVSTAFDAALVAGDGSVALGGALIDRPIAERARATLRLAEELGMRQPRGGRAARGPERL